MPGTFDRTRGRALTREVSPSYAEAVSSYLGTRVPDYEAAKRAQEVYFAALRAHGTEVITPPYVGRFPRLLLRRGCGSDSG